MAVQYGVIFTQFGRLFSLIACLLFVYPEPCHAEAETPSTASDESALKLYDQALTTLREKRAKLIQQQYRATVDSRQFDADDTTTASRRQVFLVFPGGNPTSRLLSETKEGRLAWLEEKEKVDREKTSSKKVSSQKAAKEKPQDKDPETVAEATDKYQLRDRYLWLRLPDENFRGVMAQVITFSPRPDFPARTSEERFCNRLTGKLWLSPRDGTILQADARLISPHRLLWIIATLQKMEFTYRIRGGDSPGVFDDSDTWMKLDIALPFSHVRQEHSLGVDQFAPRKK